jgi:hypothetical protein
MASEPEQDTAEPQEEIAEDSEEEDVEAHSSGFHRPD